MANQYINISYDPAKQGYSTSTWRTMYGDVAISSGQLELNKASILHYGDILRGDAVFSINIGAPVAGDNSRIGFTQYNKGAYLYFLITDGVLTAECSNGTVSASSAEIEWDATWTDTDTEFRIKWEAGTATFFIDGQYKASFCDTYVQEAPTVLVPGCPMSLYVASDSPDLMLLDYILVGAIQSYVVSTGNTDSSFEVIVKESDKISISESVTGTVDNPGISVSDSLTIAENLSEVKLMHVSVNTAVQSSEAVTMHIPYTGDIDSSDTLNISEDTTVDTPA